MYKVIHNIEVLEQWLSTIPEECRILFDNPTVSRHLQMLVECLDENYGETREVEADLGGYTIVFYGADVLEQFAKLLQYHKLNEDEYEWEDIFYEPDHTRKATFRLYLCSSDYSVQIVLIENKEGN